MVVVNNLQEGLDLAAELNLPLGHSLGHLAWVTVNSGNQSMPERFVGGTCKNTVLLQQDKTSYRTIYSTTNHLMSRL